MSKIFMSGILVECINKDLEIPPELKNFLDIDDQGIEGLDFMLKNPNLVKKIRPIVREQYEFLYGTLNIELSKQIAEMIEMLKEVESRPKDVIHTILNNVYSEEN